MNKLGNLQSALKASTGRASMEEAVPAIPATVYEAGKPPGKAATRVGKKNIAAWLPSDFKRSIRLVQAKLPGDPSLEDLMAEAFNDLFIKSTCRPLRSTSPEPGRVAVSGVISPPIAPMRKILALRSYYPSHDQQNAS